MKCLTLWQPYATLVATGLKRIETRSWGTGYRGPLLIHAAAKQDDETRALFREVNEILVSHRLLDLLDILPYGAVVAACELVDVFRMPTEDMLPFPTDIDLSSLEMAFGDYRPGRYGWQLENVRPLGPIPWRGMQGLWPVPEELDKVVRAQLEVEAER
jgi:activating signal cointegrator 1